MPTPFDNQLAQLCWRCDVLVGDARGHFNSGLHWQLNVEARSFMAVASRALDQLPLCTVDHAWIQHALVVMRSTRYFMQRYEQQHGPQHRDHFAQLYELKHCLLTALCLVHGPAEFQWEAGLATDTPVCISLLFLHSDQALPRFHVHWPRWYVPRAVIAVMHARYGCWPLENVLP